MAAQDSSKHESWLVEEWLSRFAQVIESMTGELPQSKSQRGPLEPEDGLFWWEQGFSLAPNAKAWIGASALSWREIGGRVLRAAGIEDGDDQNLKSTYQEVLNQSHSSLAQSISSRLRREVVCSSGNEAEPAQQDLITFPASLQFGGVDFPLSAAFSPEFVKALHQEETPKPESRNSKVPEEAPTDRAAAPEQHSPRSLDLLLDVELPVSVSFGRAQLPLKDVIKLTTGSIVELNRAVSEPVEIIVNNCVIARGQVVVVEGNFGVRIQQVISRQERLRTLK